MVTFSFSVRTLTDGSVPAVSCAVCSAEGHVTSSCPEEQLPPLTPLPHLRPDYMRMLDRICEDVARYDSLEKNDSRFIVIIRQSKLSKSLINFVQGFLV